MNMGNVALRKGIEPTSLAFQVGVLTTSPPRLPDVTTLPTPTCLCESLSLPKRSVQINNMFILLYKFFYQCRRASLPAIL